MQNEKLLIMIDKDQLQGIVENAVRKAMYAKTEPPKEELIQLGEYVPQVVAMKILSRKTTWFHTKRKSGELLAIKSANQWWYKRSDLEDYVRRGVDSRNYY